MLDTGCKMLNAGYWILDKTRFSDPKTRKRIWDRMILTFLWILSENIAILN